MEITQETNTGSVREWFALHTRARHEKAIAARLGAESAEVYLPLHRRRKKWRNGVLAEVDFPLLPCYLFVHAEAGERPRLLQTRGVLGFAAIATVTDEEIARLRAAAELRAEPHAPIEGGERVRIIAGPLAGAEGVLERSGEHCRVVLTYEPMRRAIAVPVHEAAIEPMIEAR